MIKVQKRNGTLVPYEVDKIKNAISKAFKSCDYQVEEKVIDDIVAEICLDKITRYIDKIGEALESIYDLTKVNIDLLDEESKKTLCW